MATVESAQSKEVKVKEEVKATEFISCENTVKIKILFLNAFEIPF